MIVIKVLSIIFIMVGFLLLGLSGPVFQTRADFINTAASTKGVVTEIVRRASTSRQGIFTHYSYKIAYQAGQEYFEAVTAESHSSPEYEVGQTVTVLYDRQHPNQATLNDFSMLWVD